LCVDECRTAGYNAIEFIRVGGEVDEKGEPVADSGASRYGDPALGAVC
jgi:hypothetical protein